VWGDVHNTAGFYGKTADPMMHGLYTVAQSKDGRFNSQMFQCPASFDVNVGWINAVAYDIDGVKIQIIPLKTITRELGPVTIRADGIEYSSDQIPFTIPGTTIEFRAHKPPYGFHIVTDGFDARVEHFTHMTACGGKHCSYMNLGITLDTDNFPDASASQICTVGPGAEPVADESKDADWSKSIFTEADHVAICDYCEEFFSRQGNEQLRSRNGGYIGCAKPPPTPPAPPAKEECAKNGCSWTHAQQLCHSLQGDEVLNNDCLFDFCLDCEDVAAEEFVAEEEDEHPKPTCTQGTSECAPGEVCRTAVKMNTLTVSQNNLGGVGPDEGAEEIRYGNAAVVNGQNVDLVVTTDGTFKTSKPAKNGKSGAFGIINVKCGSSVTLNMKVVDSETGAPVTLDSVAVSWFDLDEGKKQKGRATVTSCGSTGAIVSQNTELTMKREGDCETFTSSVAGTGKDNPKSPHQLSSLHKSRSVTLPFKGVSEWSSTLSLAKGPKGRNFMFAIEPSVACGESE